MKQLTLNGKTLGVVDVPEDAAEFEIDQRNIINWVMFSYVDNNNIRYDWDEIELPPGQWSILGRLNDITEEQAAVFGKGDVTGFDAELFKINIRSHGIEGNPLIIINTTK